MTQNPHDDERDGQRPADPVERREPDLDPGLAPDPDHAVTSPAHREEEDLHDDQ